MPKCIKIRQTFGCPWTFGGPSTKGGKNLPGHRRDLNMVAKGPVWTYLNLEILPGQIRCLDMPHLVDR